MIDLKTTPQSDMNPTAVPMLYPALGPPFFLLLVLLVFSPNFRWQSETKIRTAAYGSDYLQEWIGGKIVASQDRDRLYDLDHVQSLQHDPAIVGFEWPAEDYYPMVYPPFHYLLVSPFSLLPYRYAAIAWACCSALAFAATGWLLGRFHSPMRSNFSGWFIGMCLFLPWIACLSMGQKSTFLLFLITGTFLLLQSGKNFWAGIVFGLVAVKPQLGLLIGAAMIIKRQWSFVAGAVLMVGILSGVSYLIEPRWWKDYIVVISGMGDYLETAGYQLNDAHSLWGGLKLTLASFPPAVTKGISSLLVVGLVGLVGWSLRGPWQPTSERFRLQFSLLVFATILISPHLYGYDLTIALLPLLLILLQTGFRPQKTSDRWLVGLAVTFFVFAGSFSKFAALVGFQPSLLVMLTMIGLLATKLINGTRRVQAT